MDEQIAQFVSITGADSDRAKFFVESANGDIETALSTFFEADGAADVDDDMDEAEETTAPTASVATASSAAPTAASSTGPRTFSGEPAPEPPASWGKQAATSSSARKPGGGFSASGGQGRGIATLRDLQGEAKGHDHNHDDDSDDEDGKKPANFYTGGERSGLNVQNPDRHKDSNAPDIVKSILKKAQDASKKMAEAGGSSSAKGASASKPSFSGKGRTIKDEISQDTPVQAAPPSLSQLPPPPPGGLNSEYLRALRNMPMGFPQGEESGNSDADDAEEEVVIRHATFWQDGFTIAGGPLCSYDDPQHAETLALLNTNRAPLHLLKVKFNQRVDLRVEQKTHEKYKAPPPPPMKPFEGQGNRLGTPLPAMVGKASSSSATVPTTSQSQAAPPTSVPDPATLSFQVDASQPTTQIQIRLGDGQRMVAKVNHTHTVADIRQYINASHPGMTARAYTLQSSFPPKPLTDEAMSIKEAGLINSVVIQKWS